MAFLAIVAAARAAAPTECAPCHRPETAAFSDSAMAHALRTAAEDKTLRSSPKLAVALGGYHYGIVREGSQSIYTVTNGTETLRVPIEWVFGDGTVGQTFVFEREGKWYESHVSYFSAIRGLDLTLGADPSPRDLPEALGRVTAGSEMRRCFECHATNVSKSSPFSAAGITPGVQCERCHGSAEAHLRASRPGGALSAPMRKLGALTTEEQSDFCGQCHRSWSQVASQGPRGIQNIRFQPYRLAGSRCYDATDNRIKCTACHNPHRPVETSAAAYDSKCVSCHSRASAATSGAAVRLCPTATHDCVTCHMPRLELPGSHQKFTDHRIRIVRANEAYPD